jgi:hypothetical protein
VYTYRGPMIDEGRLYHIYLIAVVIWLLKYAEVMAASRCDFTRYVDSRTLRTYPICAWTHPWIH